MNKLSLLFYVSLLLAALPVNAADRSGTVINLADYLSEAGKNADATSAVRRALTDCKKTKAAKLIIPEGTYHFYPDMATETYFFISNNDEGLKRIAFFLDGFSDFVIDGQGSSFIFHGYICPFIINRSANIVLRNLRVDWERTFHSEAKIISVYKDSMDVSFSNQYPYSIENDLLFFKDSSGVAYPYKSLLEFDSKKRETAFMARDYYTGPYVKVKKLADNSVRLFVTGITASEGNIMTFAPAARSCPAITLSASDNIEVKDITILHAGGMGVIAQMSSNISLQRVSVTPLAGRIISTTADATHFANCYGKITIDSCLFENQKDDATNIHGIYARVESQSDRNSIIVRLVHHQQYGQQLFAVGDSIEFVKNNSLVTYYHTRVDSANVINKELVQLFVSGLVPDKSEGNVVATLKHPEVLISNCTIRNNRARGLLLGSRGSTIIKGNYFHTPGAAILFEGDANYWFEQSGVRNVTITENVFENCNYGVWGNALIQVASGIKEALRSESRYNRGIYVHHNIIRRFDPRLVNIYSVKGFEFYNNKIIDSKDYPNTYQAALPFVITHSDGVKLDSIYSSTMKSN